MDTFEFDGGPGNSKFPYLCL